MTWWWWWWSVHVCRRVNAKFLLCSSVADGFAICLKRESFHWDKVTWIWCWGEDWVSEIRKAVVQMMVIGDGISPHINISSNALVQIWKTSRNAPHTINLVPMPRIKWVPIYYNYKNAWVSCIIRQRRKRKAPWWWCQISMQHHHMPDRITQNIQVA